MSGGISVHDHINCLSLNFKKVRIGFTHCVTILLFIPRVLLKGGLLLSPSRYLFNFAPLNFSILFKFGKVSMDCTNAAVNLKTPVVLFFFGVFCFALFCFLTKPTINSCGGQIP